MTTPTLSEIKAEQARLAEIIAAFEKASSQRLLLIDGIEIALDNGEHYAGAVLGEDGSVKHHLVLMAGRPDGAVDWNNAKKWAASIGGALPDRQEAALVFANCKPHLDAAWHWTSEQHTNESYAWFCSFSGGTQDNDHKVISYAARAVRRVTA